MFGSVRNVSKYRGVLTISILVFLCCIKGDAAIDTVDVTISVPALYSFEAGGDVLLTATTTDLSNTYIFDQNASTMEVKVNTNSWTLFASLDSAYTDYTLWVDDIKVSGHVSGSGFNEIPVSPASNSMNLFVGYGNEGNRTYNLDWLATGLGWDTYQGDQVRTVTFTLTT